MTYRFSYLGPRGTFTEAAVRAWCGTYLAKALRITGLSSRCLVSLG